MKLLHTLQRYWQYYRAATVWHQLPSTAAQDFVASITDRIGHYYAWQDIETVRQQLIASTQTIEVVDHGAGSRVYNSRRRRVADIAKTSVSPAWQCRQLYRATRYLAPQRILEMGTSLGVSSAYLASAQPQARCITLEGDPSIAAIARQTHEQVGCRHVEIAVGSFVDTLPTVLKDLGQVDLAFVDGHHSYKPTLYYTEQILHHCHDKTVLIFDDIYWSDQMLAAWNDIKQWPQVTMAVDMFSQGYLFFDPRLLPRQQVVYAPSWIKPWHLGTG